MSYIWKPAVFESNDGLPIASTVNDLFRGFPYDRLPSNQIIAIWMRPEAVVSLILFYLSSKPLFMRMTKAFQTPTSVVFRNFVALHNLGLAIFSGVVAWNTWPIVLFNLSTNGFFSTYCDVDGTFWHSGLGAWSYIFYISKYYEFLDTWILVLKGKDASFLQVYHHAGIVFIMWAGVASQGAWLLFVVLLNSVIHTFMYVYFFIKTVSPLTEVKAARYLTMAQIIQFFTGIICTLGVFFMGSRCDTESSRFALACLHIYGLGLIALFVSFANRKYKKS